MKKIFLTAKKKLYKKIIFALFLLPTAFCANSQAANVSAESTKPISMRIAWLPGVAGKLYAAQAYGLFKKHGLDAKFIRFNSGPAMNAAFKSKSLDVGYSGPPGLLTILSTGTSLRMFMIGNDATNAEGLVARPTAGINSIKGLKGKTVAVPRGTTAWVALTEAMKQNGLKPEDVKILDMKAIDMVPAYKHGSVDAIWIWAPWLYDLQSAGAKLVTLDSPKWGVVADSWYGRSEWVVKHPEAIKRFLATMDEANKILKKDPDSVAKYMSSYMGISIESAKKLLSDTYFPSLEEQASPKYILSLTNSKDGLTAALQHYAHVLHEAGILRTIPNLSGVIDSKYLRDYLNNEK